MAGARHALRFLGAALLLAVFWLAPSQAQAHASHYHQASISGSANSESAKASASLESQVVRSAEHEALPQAFPNPYSCNTGCCKMTCVACCAILAPQSSRLILPAWFAAPGLPADSERASWAHGSLKRPPKSFT